MIGVLHIIVGPQGKAYFSPGCQYRSLAASKDCLSGCLAVHNALTCLWIYHQSPNPWRYSIIDIICQEVVGIEHIPSFRVVYLQVQMRSHAVSRVAAKRYQLSLRHRALQSGEIGIALTRLMLILVTAQRCLDARREGPQMAIHAGIAFRMGDIDGIAEAIESHCDTTHIPVADGVDRFPFHPVSLDVEATMKMMGTGLAKITRQ